MRQPPPRSVPLLPGLSVLVRGWLHGNSVLIQGAHPSTDPEDPAAAALIDTGYHSGASELERWLAAELRGGLLARVLLTHVHSDHAGGVAALGPRTGAQVSASDLAKSLVERWDERGLWLGDSGQEMPLFQVDRGFAPGDVLEAGGRRWRVLPTPGHMRCAVSLFAEADGVLVTGDALWEKGFGLLDPWVEGADCFELAAAALAELRGLRGVRIVIPGHGAPFTDLEGALGRAETRLAAQRADPDSLRRAVAQSGVGFLAMARPELGPDRLAEVVHGMVAAHPPFHPRRDTPTAEALVAEALGAWKARAAGAGAGAG